MKTCVGDAALSLFANKQRAGSRYACEADCRLRVVWHHYVCVGSQDICGEIVASLKWVAAFPLPSVWPNTSLSVGIYPEHLAEFNGD